MQYYETLGLSRYAEPSVIDAAYKALMKQYHPDIFDGEREIAEDRSKSLNEAYAVLKDPLQRAAYDRSIDGGGYRQAAPPASPRREDPKPKSSEARPSNWGTELWPEGYDPLRMSRKPQTKLRKRGWKITGGIFLVFLIAAIVRDAT